MKILRNMLLAFLLLAVVFAVTVFVLSLKPVPKKIIYGMSFNTLYAKELGLNWKEVYEAILVDLNVKHLRLAAHWPMVEPLKDVYNFNELDYQVRRAGEEHADVIMAVGRRLPRWPECHVPDWAQTQSWEDQKKEILKYITVVVNRYKNDPTITYWQVENEPYLTVFAKDHCGDFDEAFFEQEIALFRSLDPSRPLLVTDSGNLGKWFGAYKHGDSFGTSVYIYFWNPDLGQFKTIIPAWFYRVKEHVMALLYGKKETMLIELSAEPWLLQPITDTDIDTQYSRMNPTLFNAILQYAKDTRLEKQYLWGAEWWYWLKERNRPEMWNKGKELFGSNASTAQATSTKTMN